MNIPTRIEKLDQQFPGLADKVRLWFNQGLTAKAVALLLREQYQVSVHPRTVGVFRTRRWVRERKLGQEKETAAAASAEFTRLLEMKAAGAAGLPGVGK
ncbi:MAG: hypothetical protein WAO35_12245 [Terriglobia bacterium]